MQSPCINACKTITGFTHQHHAFYPSSFPSSTSFSSARKFNSYPSNSCNFDGNDRKLNDRRRLILVKQAAAGGKENVWSVDNEMAEAEKEKGKMKRRKKKRRGVADGRKRNVGNRNSRFMVSGAMLVEVETVLQTQEPVIRPAWHTFASSLSGIWKGVGAVFSPFTAEMEPIDIGNKNENLFDCYTLSRVEAVPSASGEQTTQIKRRINWVTLNPYGEIPQLNEGEYMRHARSDNGQASLSRKETSNKFSTHNLPKFEAFNFGRSDIMEEDVMGIEPGLVFFEDGSYSRGPVDIRVGEFDESKYFLSPTYKFEQCLVKGCHKRLRIVHTIEFGNGGSDIQIMRVAVYEEQWDGPASIPDESELEVDLQPFSQRERVQPSELIGSWKVFEVSATPIYGEDIMLEESHGAPYVYLCTETLKKRSLPEHSVYFGEEEMLDMQDVTILWLPGGVTGYVDVNKDGILCVGVGWYSDEGINLVMERDYGTDGKLKEVRWKSEMKRRWSNPPPM
ncbi:uncharacterized protein [Coffea arabica]|uniref:Uncharacterized protein isoform X1 n=1 Tax=Coffea arabica TaxID=13443 RepID=A0A6P6VU50_COFAR|nr:uncharacterized protein LOC113726883 [Coffea arabica]